MPITSNQLKLKLKNKRIVKSSKVNISKQTFQKIEKLDLIIMAFRRKNV